MSLTCCPQYTIRCDATNFRLNKSHKKAIKRVNRFLISGIQASGGGEESHKDGDDIEGGGESHMIEAAMVKRVQPSDIEVPDKNQVRAILVGHIITFGVPFQHTNTKLSMYTLCHSFFLTLGIHHDPLKGRIRFAYTLFTS